jgi:adenylate cyclase
MTTPREYAKSATAALSQVLHISTDDFDAEETAAVIEHAIRNATRERESKARRQLKKVQAAGQERLRRLLSSSPAVIYSFKATVTLRRTSSATISRMCSATHRRSI